MNLNLILLVAGVSVISSIISIIFMKKVYYRSVEKFFRDMEETIKVVWGKDNPGENKRFWELNPDYKEKADSLIRDARELWDGLEILKEKQEEITEEVENTNKMLEKKNVKVEEILKIIETFDDEKFKKLKKIIELMN